jgi:TolB-like protein
LPLADLSPDTANDYFADGLTEALITAVARLGGVRVISRTSSLCYKNTRKSIPAIAQELNVDAIVEGSVLRTSDYLRLTCRLMDPRTEESL